MTVINTNINSLNAQYALGVNARAQSKAMLQLSSGSRINSAADPVEARKAFIARQPMGRLAQADDIVPIVVYLASDESAFATGQVFSIDGGMTI